MNELHYLVYVSSATRELSISDVEDIINSSVRNNKIDNITGILFHVEGNFLQVLEGTKDLINKKFEKISLDTRHTGVIKIVEEELDQRNFSDWNMALVNAKKQDWNNAIEFIDYESKLNEANSPHPVIAFLKTFVQVNKSIIK